MAREKRNRNKGSVGNNRKTGDEFLIKNKLKPGVTETESGLQYQIIDKGEGPSPDGDSYITIHQRCLLLSGKILVDSYKENKPAEAKIKELIEGLAEGILLMNKGSKYRFYIPPELGWGKKGSSSTIPPNSVLIFDVRLIDFW